MRASADDLWPASAATRAALAPVAMIEALMPELIEILLEIARDPKQPARPAPGNEPPRRSPPVLRHDPARLLF